MMYRHGPGCLDGPLSAERPWWDPLPPQQAPSDVNDSTPLLRSELISRVRREIAEGTYDTEEKWNLALERLLGRIDRP
jgi:hypothetical protein